MKIRFLMGITAFALSTFARAEMVLVTSPATGISSLPQSQVARLFFGQAREFPNGTAAVPMDVSGTSKDQFAHQVLKKSPEQVEKYWARMIFTGKAKPPREVRPESVKAMVVNTPGAISYLDRSQVDSSVKVVEIIAD